MQKLVTLQLDGDFTTGFKVIASIGQERMLPKTAVNGRLPASIELEQQLQHWRQNYRQIGNAVRIKPKQITYLGAIHLVDNCKAEAQKLAAMFTDWLTAESFRIVDQHLREELNRDDRIRILIRTHHQSLHQLPWHLWDFVDRYPHAEVAMSGAVFEQPSQRPPIARSPQVKVLAILGHSAGLNTEVDRQVLTSLPNAKITWLVEPERQQINDKLWDQPWDILFFAGHSQTLVQGELAINATDTLTLEELQYGLRHAIRNGLQLAIFNSCNGLGLAYALERLQLPQMIVMREPIPDQVAHEFLKYFLRAYAQGSSLYMATRCARERLQGLERDFPCASWLPMIFQHPSILPLDWQGLMGVESTSLPSRRTPARWPRNIDIVLSSILITGIVIFIRGLGGFSTAESWVYDTFMAWRPLENQDERLLIVTIDDADIAYQEQKGMQLNGSLSTQAWQQLLGKLHSFHPQSIGLDIYRTHPVTLQSLAASQSPSTPLFGICKVPAPSVGDLDGVDPPPDLDPNYVGFSDFMRERLKSGELLNHRHFINLF